MLDRVKKEINTLKDAQLELENKTTEIIGKIAALD